MGILRDGGKRLERNYGKDAAGAPAGRRVGVENEMPTPRSGQSRQEVPGNPSSTHRRAPGRLVRSGRTDHPVIPEA